MKQKKAKTFERILEAPLILWTMAFVLVALIYMMKLSLPLSNYSALLSKVYLGVLLRTLKLSISTVLISLVLGLPYAYSMAGLKKKSQNMVLLMVIVPFCINALIRIYGWRILLLKLAPKFLYTDGAVLLGMVYGLFPFMVLPIYNAICKLDQKTIEAAESLGAGKLQIFKEIILPQILPGIETASILVFIPSTGLYFLNDLLGGSKSVIAGSLIQSFIAARNTGKAAAVSVIMLMITMFFMVLYTKAQKKAILSQKTSTDFSEYTTIKGIIYLICTTLLMYLPVFVVILYSFNGSHARVPLHFTGFSLEWYIKLFSAKNKYIEALLYSIKVGLRTSIFALVVGTMAAIGFGKVFTKSKETGFDYTITNLSYVPIMIPEVIMGLALMMILNAIGIFDNTARLIIGHSTFCIPYVYMNVRTGLLDMNASVLEASMSLGAGRMKSLLHILIPSIIPSMITGFAMAFAMSIDDFVISFFVYGAGSGTLPMLVYSSVKTGVSPMLNALCTLIVVAVFVIMLAYYYFERKNNK